MRPSVAGVHAMSGIFAVADSGGTFLMLLASLYCRRPFRPFLFSLAVVDPSVVNVFGALLVPA
jgi:hypothetical protein